ncbi:MAG: uracil-DNA glycosylase [Ilumatobacteraceae bacterium]
MATPSQRSVHSSLIQLERDIHACTKCPRLVKWCSKVAKDKRAAYANDDYWGKPIAGFGDPLARILVLGLAPGAHGANRTGRVFTGDRSGEWLFRALHKAGLANQPQSSARGDGLQLKNTWVSVAVRCAPPQNKPTPAEKKRCAPYLERELEALSNVRVVICLGSIALQSMCDLLEISPRPKFGHGVVVKTKTVTIVCSYHPSQQNTFTGKLTEKMLDSVIAKAVRLAK